MKTWKEVLEQEHERMGLQWPSIKKINIDDFTLIYMEGMSKFRRDFLDSTLEGEPRYSAKEIHKILTAMLGFDLGMHQMEHMPCIKQWQNFIKFLKENPKEVKKILEEEEKD